MPERSAVEFVECMGTGLVDVEGAGGLLVLVDIDQEEINDGAILLIEVVREGLVVNGMMVRAVPA